VSAPICPGGGVPTLDELIDGLPTPKAAAKKRQAR
jgi:hypothetical protein